MNQWTVNQWTSEPPEPVNRLKTNELHEPVNHLNQLTTWTSEPVNHLNQWTSEVAEPVNHLNHRTTWTSEPTEPVNHMNQWTSEPPEPVNCIDDGMVHPKLPAHVLDYYWYLQHQVTTQNPFARSYSQWFPQVVVVTTNDYTTDVKTERAVPAAGMSVGGPYFFRLQCPSGVEIIEWASTLILDSYC